MALSVFPAGGGRKKKIAIGGWFTDTYATITANFMEATDQKFAQASGNGILLTESGNYAISLITGSSFTYATSKATLTITRPGMDNITQTESGQVATLFWTGNLPAGSVVTASTTKTGGANYHGITMTIVK